MMQAWHLGQPHAIFIQHSPPGAGACERFRTASLARAQRLTAQSTRGFPRRTARILTSTACVLGETSREAARWPVSTKLAGGTAAPATAAIPGRRTGAAPLTPCSHVAPVSEADRASACLHCRPPARRTPLLAEARSKRSQRCGEVTPVWQRSTADCTQAGFQKRHQRIANHSRKAHHRRQWDERWL